MVIEEPGIYTMPAADYHRDPCPTPSLSSSIAKLLCLSSPAHARQQHPRLNPDAVEDEAEHFDIGTAAHAMLLEGAAAIEVVVAKDWRSNAAKEARDRARAAGKVPLLEHVWQDVLAMLSATRPQLVRHRDGGSDMFTDGHPERVVIWQEGATWCRARLDWLRLGAIDDYKTTSASANPDKWTRTMFDAGFDLQAAWYLRGVKAVTGYDATFRFCVQETYPPYALSVIGLGPDALVLAEKKVLFALETWAACLDSNDWASYPRKTAFAGLPPWIEAAWLEKELR